MSPAKESSSYETSDARVAPVLAGAGALVAGIGFSLVIAAFLYRSGSVRPARDAATTTFTHGPDQESTIVRDWREQDRLVREHLESYAWVDREKGLVRIPIERAMEQMAQEERKNVPKKP